MIMGEHGIGNHPRSFCKTWKSMTCSYCVDGDTQVVQSSSRYTSKEMLNCSWGDSYILNIGNQTRYRPQPMTGFFMSLVVDMVTPEPFSYALVFEGQALQPQNLTSEDLQQPWYMKDRHGVPNPAPNPFTINMWRNLSHVSLASFFLFSHQSRSTISLTKFMIKLTIYHLCERR